MLNVISNWRRERAAVSQLSRLSDRELADLGIQRHDIKSVARFATTMAHNTVSATVERPFICVDLGPSRVAESAPSIYRPTSLAA